MSNSTRRKLERAQKAQKAQKPPEPAPVLLVATMRKSRSGHTAVIDSLDQQGMVREIFGTCSAGTMPEVLMKAYEAMMAEAGNARRVQLVVEGEPVV